MEDASSGGPLSVESSRLKESVTLLEEEVVVDELLLVSLRHAGKWIVRTLKITSHSRKDPRHNSLNLIPLGLGDSWAKWERSEVPTDSDTSGEDHGVIFGRERWALKHSVVHVADVSVIFFVAVVVLDDLVEKLGESAIGVVATSVHSNAGVDVLGARQDHLLEWHTSGVPLASVLGEDLRSEEFAQRRFGAQGELDGSS